MKTIYLTMATILTACATAIPNSAFPSEYSLPQVTDRAGMPFEIDGAKFEGTAVVDRKASLMFAFYPPKGTLQFIVTTCHREEYFPRPEDGKPIKWQYVPAMYLENLKSCFLTAKAITKNAEVHVALVEFHQGTEETLPAFSKCNGKVNKRIGAELCQTNGTGELHQVIEFDTEVVLSDLQPGCSKMEPALVGPYSFQYKLSPGFCVYKFMDKQKRVFRLTTFGYTTIKDANP